MKRIFTAITILISLSLIGLIVLQLSWLQSMVLLKEEQLKEKIDGVVQKVGIELEAYKLSFSPPRQSNTAKGIFFDESTFDFLQPQVQTIAKRFSVQELYDTIRTAFVKAGLDKMKFEFSITLADPRNSFFATAQKRSTGFAAEIEDSVNNHSSGRPLQSSATGLYERFASDEILVIVGLDYKKLAVAQLRWRFFTALLFTLIIIAAFYLTVRTMLRQKKLSEIKNDFINNMTHEFKTPIATISLAVDAMKNEKVINNKERLAYFSSIIKEENKRMNRQVETILKASQLEKQEINLALQPMPAHDTIKDVVENFALQLNEKNGKAVLDLMAANDTVKADPVHLSNLVNNLMDNALKYSKDSMPPLVRITTTSTDKKFILKIADNGIGMNKETLRRVFERFYRAHTGNVHNVKGFGLGLSYVKSITEAHHGEIKVESVLGKGSTFIVELPLHRETA